MVYGSLSSSADLSVVVGVLACELQSCVEFRLRNLYILGIMTTNVDDTVNEIIPRIGIFLPEFRESQFIRSKFLSFQLVESRQGQGATWRSNGC